jgi:hypothetical protein
LDLSQWIEILGKFDDILEKYVNSIPKCNDEEVITFCADSKQIVCSVLRFLAVLLKGGKRKKYFQSFEVSE